MSFISAQACADGTTEHTEDEGLGVNICCSSASALCQTGNNNGKSWNFPSYLYQREIQPVELVSLECSGSRSGKKTAGNKTKGEMEYCSTIHRAIMMTFHLWNERLIFTSEEVPLRKKHSLQRQNCVQLIFLYLRCNGNMGLPRPCVLCTCENCYSFLWYRPACTYTFVRDLSLMEGSRYHD